MSNGFGAESPLSRAGIPMSSRRGYRAATACRGSLPSLQPYISLASFPAITQRNNSGLTEPQKGFPHKQRSYLKHTTGAAASYLAESRICVIL